MCGMQGVLDVDFLLLHLCLRRRTDVDDRHASREGTHHGELNGTLCILQRVAPRLPTGLRSRHHL